MSEQAIDRNAYEMLAASTGREFARELAETFQIETPAMLADLRLALRARDSVAFRRCAHTIKSNAATFGALRLQTVARQLEELGRDDRLEEVGDGIDQLEAAFAAASSELKELCR